MGQMGWFSLYRYIEKWAINMIIWTETFEVMNFEYTESNIVI